MQAKEDIQKQSEIEEKPNSFWNKVYIAVLIFTVIIIFALAFFSEYFA